MPIVKKLHRTCKSTLYIWEVTESLRELNDLTGEGYKMPDKLVSPVRKAEHLAVRACLRQAGLDPLALTYRSTGQPVYPGFEISISHCYPKVALLVSSVPCGVDIQTPEAKLFRVARRFMNDGEWQKYQQNPDFALVLWTCKEAIFKRFPDYHLHFAPHICHERSEPPHEHFVVHLGDALENVVCEMIPTDNHLTAITFG
jgi:hypothetical protein